jgi:hypothetical protein
MTAPEMADGMPQDCCSVCENHPVNYLNDGLCEECDRAPTDFGPAPRGSGAGPKLLPASGR